MTDDFRGDPAFLRDEAIRQAAIATGAMVRIMVLESALEAAQGEAYLGALEGDDTPDPLTACHNVITVCQGALKDRLA